MAAQFTGKLVKVEGPARSGKTEQLLAHIASLIEGGTQPGAIALACNTAFAAQAARERLAAMLGEGGETLARQVAMGRAADFCEAALATLEAVAFTGRAPRVLTPDERNFFLEDMKTMGQPVRRLRKMLGFFFAKWANLDPEDEWLESGEESKARALMGRLLTSENAMLPEEVAPLAYAFLRSPEGAAQRKRFDVVLIDDFQNLSRAEQDCMCLFAKNQVVVAGNAAQNTAGSMSNPEGFANFEAARANVQVVALDTTHGIAEAGAFVEAVLAQGAVAAQHVGAGSLELVKWNTPEDELAGIAELVVHDVKGGIEEKDICIVAPNKLWATTLAKELAKRGVKSTSAAFQTRLGGDPREASRCRALVAWTKLCLLANPSDVVAWRCWCGIGNYLTNSDAWSGLMEFAANNGLELLEAMDAAATLVEKGEEPFLRASAIAKARAAGLEFIEHAQGRRGFALLKAIGASGLAAFETCEELAEGDEDAPALLAIARESLCAPVFGDDPHLVRIMGYGDMAGLSFERMYATGAVDGYIPSAASFETVSTEQVRMRELERCRRTFCDAVSKAQGQLVVSYFSKADLELAERTHMLVRRVRAGQDGRIALVTPSTFIGDARSACPGACGGQAKLAEIGVA